MATLRFAAFGQDDAPLGGPEIGTVYLTTRDATLVGPPVTGDDKGLAIDGARLAAAAGDGFVINVRWAMPGFGYLWLQADNGGQYYAIPRVGNAQVWNLNYELARTRVLWNSQLTEATAPRQSLVPTSVRKAVDEAGTLLHDAMFANHDRRSRLADDALARAIDGGERLAVCAARLAMGSGPRVPDFDVPALHLANPLGTAVLESAESRDRWKAVFDEATVTVSSEDLAGAGGDLDARVTAALTVAGRVRGRGLLPYVDGDGLPVVPGDESEASRWREAAVAMVRRYKDRIATWELVPPVLGGTMTERHVTQIAATAEAVKQAVPEVTLVLWPGDVFTPRLATPSESPGGASRVRGAAPVIHRCRNLTGAIDALAIALYWPNCDLLQLMRTVDTVARIGLPVHLLCAAVPSQWQTDPRSRLGRGTGFVSGLGFWRHPWTPDVQATYTTGLAQLARAHPAVDTLEWLDFSDAVPHEFPHAGLLDAAGEPKCLHAELADARQRDFAVSPDWGEGLLNAPSLG